MKSQLTLLVRAMYSNPPAHGARVVNLVLKVYLRDLYIRIFLLYHGVI